jgi:hypothetical protein
MGIISCESPVNVVPSPPIEFFIGPIYPPSHKFHGHPRAGVSTAIAVVSERIEKLNVSCFVTIDAADRILAVRIDEKALGEESCLDGCYVIRSNLPADQANMDIIHQGIRIWQTWNGHSGP